MTFAFFEEIDGSSGRAERLGTGGGDGFLFGRRPCARGELGRVARQIAQLEEHFGVRLLCWSLYILIARATTSIAEISPVTSTAETRSTDSLADERREVALRKRTALSRPFCVRKTDAYAAHRRK